MKRNPLQGHYPDRNLDQDDGSTVLATMGLFCRERQRVGQGDVG